jgi:hypothetical protein
LQQKRKVALTPRFAIFSPLLYQLSYLTGKGLTSLVTHDWHNEEARKSGRRAALVTTLLEASLGTLA